MFWSRQIPSIIVIIRIYTYLVSFSPSNSTIIIISYLWGIMYLAKVIFILFFFSLLHFQRKGYLRGHHHIIQDTSHLDIRDRNHHTRDYSSLFMSHRRCHCIYRNNDRIMSSLKIYLYMLFMLSAK